MYVAKATVVEAHPRISMIIKHNKLIVDLLDSVVILFMLIVTILVLFEVGSQFFVCCEWPWSIEKRESTLS